MRTVLLSLHIAGAVVALVCGMLALIEQNGTAKHRLAGKLYVIGWSVLFLGGVGLGFLRAGISPFDVLNVLGMFFVVRSYSHIVRRARLGRIWLRRHYSDMLTSMAFLVVATTNQILLRSLGELYPWWGVIVLSILPTPVLIFAMRKFDRRYGFAKPKSISQETA